MIWTSVLFEGVLLTSCLVGVTMAWRRLPLSVALPLTVGLGLMVLAASSGALKFAGLTSLAEAHAFFSRLGSVGIAAIGPCWLARAGLKRVGSGLAWLVLAVGLGFVLVWFDGGWRTPIVILSLVLCLGSGASWVGRSVVPLALAVVGSACLLIAGLGIGTEGTTLGLPTIDWFHMFMAVSMLCLGAGPALTPRSPSTPL
ncbi:MAG: hypothetical protein ACI9MC_001623 [Kiritimatiellia bacterium]